MVKFSEGYHIRSKWLTIELDNGIIIFFQLDNDGNLILQNRELIPHHIYQNVSTNHNFL